MNDLIDRQSAINAIENTDCELSADAWDELTDAIMQTPSIEPWSAVRSILEELERKQERLYADYCDTTARLKAINKIAKSSQTPKRMIDGIKPLAELEVTNE